MTRKFRNLTGKSPNGERQEFEVSRWSRCINYLFPSCHLASHCLVLVVICDFAIWLVKELISTTLKLFKEAGAKEQRVIRIDAARPVDEHQL